MNSKLLTSKVQIKTIEIPRDYRTEIPNIVLEMLHHGQISPSAFILYSVYRRIAGPTGECWVGYRKLMKMARMNDITFRKARKELCSNFDVLNGKSFIHLEPGNKKLETSDSVTIEDIWPENYHFFKNKLTCVKLVCTPALKECAPLREISVQKKKQPKKLTIEETTETFSAREPVVACGAVVLEKKDKEEVVKKDKIREDDVYFYANKCGKDWTTEEILDAFWVYNASKYEISDPLKYVEGIINKKRILKKNKAIKCKQKASQAPTSLTKKTSINRNMNVTNNLKNSSEIPKKECSENAIAEPASPPFNFRNMLRASGISC